VHHRLAQVFGRRLAACMCLRDLASGTIVHDHIGVIHGDVLDAPLEFTERIPARVHHLADQSIRFRDSAVRIVDEPLLQLPPLLTITSCVIRSEWSNVQRFHAPGARLERCFCPADITDVVHDAVVLGTESRTQGRAASPPQLVPDDAADDDNRNGDKCPDQPWIHGNLPELKLSSVVVQEIFRQILSRSWRRETPSLYRRVR
jgi:hypothetical protein